MCNGEVIRVLYDAICMPLHAIGWVAWTCQALWNQPLNTLRQRQNGRHFADDIFKCIFLNENVWIPIKISLKFVPKGPINNIPSLVQIMVWRRPGAKPLSEPMMVSLLMHICVTRSQWVNTLWPRQNGWHFVNSSLNDFVQSKWFCFDWKCDQVCFRGPVENIWH